MLSKNSPMPGKFCGSLSEDGRIAGDPRQIDFLKDGLPRPLPLWPMSKERFAFSVDLQSHLCAGTAQKASACLAVKRRMEPALKNRREQALGRVDSNNGRR